MPFNKLSFGYEVAPEHPLCYQCGENYRNFMPHSPGAPPLVDSKNCTACFRTKMWRVKYRKRYSYQLNTVYEIDDYLLIQGDEIKAVSGNTDFWDIEPLPDLSSDKPYMIVKVVDIED